MFGSFEEMVKAIRKAGGDAWDDIADVDAFIDELRGSEEQTTPSPDGRDCAGESSVQPAATIDGALSVPELVEVTWRDCQTLDGWIFPTDAFDVMENRRIIRTVGYVMKRTPDQLILASSWEAMFGKICGTWGIPCPQILGVRTIERDNTD